MHAQLLVRVVVVPLALLLPLLLLLPLVLVLLPLLLLLLHDLLRLPLHLVAVEQGAGHQGGDDGRHGHQHEQHAEALHGQADAVHNLQQKRGE